MRTVWKCKIIEAGLMTNLCNRHAAKNKTLGAKKIKTKIKVYCSYFLTFSIKKCAVKCELNERTTGHASDRKSADTIVDTNRLQMCVQSYDYS